MLRVREGVHPAVLRFRFIGLPDTRAGSACAGPADCSRSSVESSPQRGNQDPLGSRLALWRGEITRVLRSDIMRF